MSICCVFFILKYVKINSYFDKNAPKMVKKLSMDEYSCWKRFLERENGKSDQQGIRTRTSSKRRFSKYVILDYDIALQIQFVDAEVLLSFVSSVVYAGCS